MPFNEANKGAYEPGTVSLRPVLIVTTILSIGALGYLGYSCVSSAGSGSSYSAPVSRFSPDSVTYLAAARTYLVRQTDGTFIALSEIEPDQPDRIGGCVIRFRPDLQANGVMGVFRDDCHGALYGRDGRPLTGSAAPMQRHPVESSGTEVRVLFTVCLSGSDGTTVEPCRG